MKKSLLFLSSLLLFFCLLIFPARTFFYACEGVNLWFHTILPSLLPFLILTSLLLETGAARRISARAEVFFQTVFGLSPAGFYALFLGLFCGFPMGARITAQLYEAEEIDRNEACYLLTFCSSPSPAFLSSYVILTAFSGQIHPGFVFGVLYGSNFLTGFLFRLVFRRFRLHRHTAHRTHSVEKKEMSKQTSKGNLLDTSIMIRLVPPRPCSAACWKSRRESHSLPRPLFLTPEKSLLSLPAPPSAVSLSLPRQTV